MSGFVIVNHDRDDKYVDFDPDSNPTGSSYTKSLERAMRYPTREAALKAHCPDSETVFPVDGLLAPLES